MAKQNILEEQRSAKNKLGGFLTALVTIICLLASPAWAQIAHWTFKEGSGSVAGDSSGNGHVGTLVNGPTWTTLGQIGGALNFDGVNDYVNAGTSSALNPSGAITIAAWVKTNNNLATQRIVSRQTSKYALFLDGASRKFALQLNTGVASAIIGNTLASNNTWYHVVGTWDGSNMNLYVNGVQDGPPVAKTGTMATDTTMTEIGSRGGGTQHFFNGSIDDVRIYNQALSASEVSSLYTSAAPTVTIAATDNTATEQGATTGTFTVSRTGSTTAALTVNYTVGGTATAGSDYQTLSGSVAIAVGQSSALVTVTPIDDAVVGEPDETVIVTIASNAAYTVGAPNSATVTITDNDPAPLPTVTIIATDNTATEQGTTTGTFTVSRTGSTAGALTVNYTVGGTATAGSDYQTLSGSVLIATGQASAPITVTPIDDAIVGEPDETVIVTIASNAAYTLGTPSSDTVTITDNDPVPLPVVTIAATDNTATEQGATTGTFTASRTGSTSAALTVNYTVSGTATAGSDYQTLSGSVVIAVGQSTGLITVTPIDDAVVGEPDETVIVTLSNNAAYTVGTPNSATVTITDNDPPAGPTGLIAHWTFNEGSGTTAGDSSGNGYVGTLTNGATWTTGQFGGAVNLDGVNDYVSLGTGPSVKGLTQYSVAAWINLNSFSSSVIYSETTPSSTLRLRLMVNSATSIELGGRGQDSDPFVILVQCTTGFALSAGTWAHVTAIFDSVSDVHSMYVNGVLCGSNSVAVSTVSNTLPNHNIRIGSRYNNLNWVNGKIDDVRVYNRALTASEVSSLYTSGTPNKLAFVTQPGNSNAGSPISGPPTVIVQDSFNNTITSSTASIAMAIGANPSGATLSGTSLKNASGGVASFNDLSINQAGTAYTLVATSAGLTSATTAGFNI